MGVKKCKDCGGQVSTSVKKCPHCGKSQSMSSMAQLGVAAAIGIAIATWGAGDDRSSSEPKSEPVEKKPLTTEEKARKERTQLIQTVAYICREVISEQLHDPDSADWVPSYEWPSRVDGAVVTVQPELRANNAYGGKVKASYNCVIDTRKENYQLVSLEQR